MGLEIKIIPTGLLQVNTVILHNPQSHNAIIIDPGGNEDTLNSYLLDNNLTLKALVHTHAHFDHIAGAISLLKKFPERKKGIKIMLHKSDNPLWENMDQQGNMFGLTLPSQTLKITDWLDEGSSIEPDDFNIKILHTPGHSPGSVSLYIPEEETVICGDVIFQGSIGRTDLWQGNYNLLMESIQNKILTLPENTMIIAGHGPETTVGIEKETNPFLTG